MMSDDAARRVCWALARECRDDDVAIVGVATPLAAAAVLLARRLLVPDLAVVIGGAVDPPDLDVARLLTDPTAVAHGAAAMLGQAALMTLLQGAAFTLQFVSPAQVDREGAINASRIRTADGWRRLAGCLALPDTAALVGRLVAYRVEGAARRFAVERVDHVTGLGRDAATRRAWGLPGRGVVAVITERGRHEIGGPIETAPLDAVPAEVDDLLDREIDRHGLIELESPSGRDGARARLAALVPS
jgi:acyl CoA:acetate/3-ketoacid CoA transferase beta subunit